MCGVAKLMTRFVGLLFLGLACALIAAAGVLLAESISFAEGCDECQAVGFGIGVSVSLVGLGLLVLYVSLRAFASAREYTLVELRGRTRQEAGRRGG
jgi:hypothetical protein